MYISMQLKLLFNETRKTRPGKLEKNCVWVRRVSSSLLQLYVYYAVSAEPVYYQQSAVLTN